MFSVLGNVFWVMDVLFFFCRLFHLSSFLKQQTKTKPNPVLPIDNGVWHMLNCALWLLLSPQITWRLGSSSVSSVSHVETKATQTHRKATQEVAIVKLEIPGLPYVFLETVEERARHSKCHSLRTINRCRLRFQPQNTYYVKQNKSTSHFWQLTVDPSKP